MEKIIIYFGVGILFRPTIHIKVKSIYLVHTVSRHGDRAPVDTYPNDPHINATFAPYGWGQLTETGMRNQFELGRFLRKHYKKFFGRKCSQANLKVQSTDTDRAKMSAQLQMTGLCAKANITLESSSNWQSLIPVFYEPLNEDKLLLSRIPCPRYFELQDQSIKSFEKMHSSSAVYEYLTAQTGMKIGTPDDVQSLYSTLKAEDDFGLDLPTWTCRMYPTLMYKLTADSFMINAWNKEMQKLRAGSFLSKLVNDYLGKVNGMKEYVKSKMFLYVGHDSTIANLLMALNVWQNQIPPYNSIIVFELHKLSNDFAVQIVFKNVSGASIHYLKLPHCDRRCPLKKFIELTKNVRSVNLESECTSKTWIKNVFERGDP